MYGLLTRCRHRPYWFQLTVELINVYMYFVLRSIHLSHAPWELTNHYCPRRIQLPATAEPSFAHPETEDNWKPTIWYGLDGLGCHAFCIRGFQVAFCLPA